MRHILGDADTDEHGRLLLGDPRLACRWCGAAAVATVSSCNRVVWWHPPTNCCERRRRAQAGAYRAAAPDYHQETT